MYLLDTNIISERMNANCNKLVEKWLEKNESSSYISVVSIEELRYGQLLLPDGKRKRAIQKRIDITLHYFRDRILKFEKEEAEKCAEFHMLAHKSGYTPGMEDIMIASIASTFGLTLVTRNTCDFEYLPIDIINPFATG